jgi:two-component system sensor histidine kinase TctE
VTRWTNWHPRAGSLRRFLLLWLLGGLWLGVATITLWQAGLSAARLAVAQDAQLVAALAETTPQHMHHRVSTMSGEWLSGDRGLAPFPWRETLPASEASVLYFGHVGGSLVRAAAAVRHGPGDSASVPVVVQVAAPWSERLPSWRELFVESPLIWVYASAALMSLVICSGVAIAMHWLGRARRALHEPAADAADYDGPAELRPAVQRMRELHHSQHRWVEEQRRFLADASHQLRTPMAVLRVQLQSAIAGDVAAAEVLPQMLHTVERAAGLAHQLLSLTKLEQLKRSGDLPQVDLHAAARDAVLELSPLIASKRLDFALEGAALCANGNAVMLGELLRNLLANAIHHALPMGRLGMLLRDGTGRTELVVWDEGPGVDDAVRPRLFQPFSAAKGGVGLGLSICTQIAEAMGASVALYNRIDNGRVVGVDAVVAWGQGP